MKDQAKKLKQDIHWQLWRYSQLAAQADWHLEQLRRAQQEKFRALNQIVELKRKLTNETS